jgi:hypothetical protein
MASDNISETSASGLKLVFLAPGMVIQWWKFMFVGDQKTYGGVRQQTRLARSELMTWVYSSVFWLLVLGIGLVGLADRHLPGGSGQTKHSSQALESRCVEMILDEGSKNRLEAQRYCADYYRNK